MTIIVVFYWLILAAASTIGIVRYKKLTIAFKVLAWSVPAVLLFNIVSKIFAVIYHSNVPVLHFEIITEFTFYALTYYYMFKEKRLRAIVRIVIIIIFVFSVLNAIWLQPLLKTFPTNVYLLTQGALTILSLMMFRQMLNYPLKVNIVKQGAFWYNTAILFYATTMFFNLGLSNYYSKHGGDIYIYFFWYGVLCIFHIIIGIALSTDNKEVISTYA